MTTGNITGFLGYNNERLSAVKNRLARIRQDLVGETKPVTPTAPGEAAAPPPPHPGGTSSLDAQVNYETAATERVLNEIMDEISTIENYVNHGPKPEVNQAAGRSIL